MTAAEASAALPPYIPLIGAIIPALLSPIVAWAIGRSRISRDSARIDYFNKRLDFLERLNKLHTQNLAEGPIRSLLDREIEHCRAFLDQEPALIPRRAELEAAAAPQSRWARFFLLTQPARSVRQLIFKGLFYFFFGIAILGFLASAYLSWQIISEFGLPALSGFYPDLLLMLFSIAFYLVIALLFRRAAR